MSITANPLSPQLAVVDGDRWDINPAKTVDGEFMVCNGKDGHDYGLIAIVPDEDDARLVASAPDLLEALKPFADLGLPEQNGFTLYTREEILAAREAINKAIGQ